VVTLICAVEHHHHQCFAGRPQCSSGDHCRLTLTHVTAAAQEA